MNEAIMVDIALVWQTGKVGQAHGAIYNKAIIYYDCGGGRGGAGAVGLQLSWR